MRKSTIVVLVFGLLAGVLTAQTEIEKEIRAIRVNTAENRLVVIIEMDKDISYENYTLLNPNRLVVDFKDVKKIAAQPYLDVNASGVKTIRSAIFDPTTYRIVFDLEAAIPYYRISEVAQGLEITFWSEPGAEPETPVTQPVLKTETEVTPPAKKETRPQTKTPVTPTPKKESVSMATETPSGRAMNSSLGITPGFYFMKDEVFKDLYGSSLFNIGLEYSFTIPLKDVHNFNVWFGFKTMSDSGLTTFLEEEIQLRMTHISVALRYMADLNRFHPFIGPGLDYLFYKETLPEGFPVQSLSDSILGVHFQAGAYIDIIEHLAANIYFKYNIAKTTKEDLEIDLGGPGLGLGLSYKFNL